MKKNIITIFSTLVILLGMAILSYPIVSNYINTKIQEKSIGAYNEVKNHTSNKDLEIQYRLATEYNDNLAGQPVHDPFKPNQGYVLSKDYANLLNLNHDGLMGIIEIPTIGVKLPIYHGCSEDVLKKGVGHIEGSSLPVGGKHSHCLLSGHRGLPESTLFTYLNRVKVGDEFYLHILNKILAYKVYAIKTVEPSKLDEIRLTGTQDVTTLITCTPYGVNTHRLLVFGKRVKYNPKHAKNEAIKSLYNRIDFKYILFGIFTGLLVLMILSFIIRRFKRKNTLDH